MDDEQYRIETLDLLTFTSHFSIITTTAASISKLQVPSTALPITWFLFNVQLMTPVGSSRCEFDCFHVNGASRNEMWFRAEEWSALQ